MLDDSLESEGETWGYRVEEGHHVDTCQIGGVRVDGSQVEGIVRSEVVVLDLDHRVTWSSGELVGEEQDVGRTSVITARDIRSFILSPAPAS